MKNLFAIFLIFVFSSLSLYSQKETYIGLKHSLATVEFYSFEDKGPLIDNAIISDFSFKSPSVGLFLGREIFNNIYLEIGIGLKNYTIGYNSKFDVHDNYKVFLYATQIPVRIKYEYYLGKRFSLKPYLGFIYCIDRSPDDHWVLDPLIDTDKFVIRTIYENNFKQKYFLANTGIDLELHISKRHSIVFNTSFAKGFTKLVQQRVNYYNWNTGENSTLYDSYVTGKGDYLMFSLTYKFSFITKKKNQKKSIEKNKNVIEYKYK